MVLTLCLHGLPLQSNIKKRLERCLGLLKVILWGLEVNSRIKPLVVPKETRIGDRSVILSQCLTTCE